MAKRTTKQVICRTSDAILLDLRPLITANCVIEEMPVDDRHVVRQGLLFFWCIWEDTVWRSSFTVDCTLPDEQYEQIIKFHANGINWLGKHHE